MHDFLSKPHQRPPAFSQIAAVVQSSLYSFEQDLIKARSSLTSLKKPLLEI